MDPKTSFLIEIHIKANPRTCRKDSTSCYSFNKVVDSDLCNFKDFVREIVDQFPHGYQELVHVFYYSDVTKASSQVRTDQELLEMFSKHADSKVVHMTITYTDPKDMSISCMCFHPEISEGLDIPCTPSIPCPSLAAGSQSTQPAPLPSQPTTNQPTTSQQNEPANPPEPSDESDVDPEPSDESDPDDDGILANPEPQNEHVGVDDEEMYFPAPNTHVGGDDVGEQSGSDPQSDSESDVEYEEDDGLIGQDPLPPVPIVAYDRDDPPMSVGSIYPNMAEFRLALSQHAIKYEFEFNIEKSDPERMRVYCSRKEEDRCKWRLYASRDTDGVSIKVRKNPKPRHTCSSARTSKVVKNATKFWICDKVKDWLMENSSLRAKELQRRIKDKYKVQVPYRRVYDGKELAHKQLFGSGSNQPELLSIEYPMLPTRENTPPPPIAKPQGEKKAEGKAKAAGKKKSSPKKKKKHVAVPHDSPAMGTRSKTTPHKHSPAARTRSKRKLSLPDLAHSPAT